MRRCFEEWNLWRMDLVVCKLDFNDNRKPCSPACSKADLQISISLHTLPSQGFLCIAWSSPTSNWFYLLPPFWSDQSLWKSHAPKDQMYRTHVAGLMGRFQCSQGHALTHQALSAICKSHCKHSALSEGMPWKAILTFSSLAFIIFSSLFIIFISLPVWHSFRERIE